MQRRLKHWGWGYEDEQPSPQELRDAAAFLTERLGFGSPDPEQPVALEDLALPESRLEPPASLSAICSVDRYERALHAYGRAYRDVVRAFRGRFEHPPDVVAHPRNEAEVEAVLDWALSAGAAVIPFGGGTSVVGGVEARLPREYPGVVTVDLKALDRVLEVDSVSQAARIQGGALGPDLERQLAEHGLTLRHFPQSFEFSTLGGWIATRSGGHFATLYTHIDELVESVRAVTPRGVWESRRLPGSGAGVSPDRMLIGSEGILGLITEAWVRVRPRPTQRASAGVRFERLRGRRRGGAGALAVRPVPVELPADRRPRGGGHGRRRRPHAVLVLGFESADHDVEEWMAARARAVRRSRRQLGAPGARLGRLGSEAVSSWREAFLRAPYLRDTFVAIGVLSETFETAITWDRFAAFHESVQERVRAAVR